MQLAFTLKLVGVAYGFVDGGYFRSAIREVIGTVFDVPTVPVDYGQIMTLLSSAGERPQKIFYYDCIGPGSGSEGESSETGTANDAVEQIRSLPGFHVQLGTLRGGRRPRQKEVDVFLATDMLMHAFNRNMDHVHLLAGDLDFRPAIDALVRMGVWVTLHAHHRSYSKDLGWASDQFHHLNSDRLMKLTTGEFREKHKLPDRQGYTPEHFSGKDSKHKGKTLSGATVEVWNDPPRRTFIATVSHVANPYSFALPELTTLLRFLDVELGKVVYEEKETRKK